MGLVRRWKRGAKTTASGIPVGLRNLLIDTKSQLAYNTLVLQSRPDRGRRQNHLERETNEKTIAC